MANGKQERSIQNVPWLVVLGLFVLIKLQVAWHHHNINLETRYTHLSPPVNDKVIQLLSLNDPVTAAKMLMFYLQAHDNQPGISIPFLKLDYTVVIEWLRQALRLDKHIQYPLLAASRIYSEVNDEIKQRQILDFVAEEFLKLPEKRWQWLAHAIFVAKHKIKDNELALEYAKQLRLNTTEDQAPNWARHMEIYILEDMNEIEAAKVLIGGLLESEKIKDANEIRFLQKRLQEYSE